MTSRPGNKDFAKLVKQLRKCGYTVQLLRRKNHFKVTGRGLPVQFLPSTPSDHRSLLNAITSLRRAGYVIER